MIKIKISGNERQINVDTSGFASKAIDVGVSYFSIFGWIRRILGWLSSLFWLFVIVGAWLISAYAHDIDTIRNCNEKGTTKLFKDGTVIECKVIVNPK